MTIGHYCDPFCKFVPVRGSLMAKDFLFLLFFFAERMMEVAEVEWNK